MQSKYLYEQSRAMKKAEQLRKSGYTIVPEILDLAESNAVSEVLPDINGAGSRQLLEQHWCKELSLNVQKKLATQIPEIGNLSAIQCTLFQKTRNSNWLVGWHQDRSVIKLPSASGMNSGRISVKDSKHFIQPDSGVLDTILSVRLHLDPSTLENGPLRVLPGTHALGILPTEQVGQLIGRYDSSTIVGDIGSAMVMRPLLVHASSKAILPSSRRVLHFVFM